MNHFFHQLVSAKPLALFRVVWGVFLCCYLIHSYWIFKLYAGEAGLLYESWYPDPYPQGRWSLFQLADGGELFFPLFALALLSAVAMTLGFFTRIFSVISWVSCICFASSITWGRVFYDDIVTIIASLMMVASLCGYSARHYSLDARKLKPTTDGTDLLIPAWAYRIFQIQLCSIYFFGGLSKIASPLWFNGTATHYIAGQIDSWSRLDITELTMYPAVNALLTQGTTFFELIIFPVLIWPRATRDYVLILGLIFFLSITLVVNLALAGPSMIMIYTCFLREDEAETIVTFFRRVGRKISVLKTRVPEKASADVKI